MPKISFTIDGKAVECEKGTMVLQAALDAGLFIPHYCYHPALSVAGNCRMCLIEIVPKPPPNAPPGWKPPPPKPAISCATEAAPGMEVVTTSKMVKEAREGVLEFLLVNHPLDCPVCDQAGECDLQNFSFRYGQDHSRFVEQKNTKHAFDLGPEVRLYGNRCISCTRCVRFCQEVSGTGELCMVERGDRTVVGTFPGTTLENPLSGNTVDICPVGALVSRDFLHKARVWQLDETPSACPHCSTGGSISVHTRDDEVQRLKPRRNPEVNGYWMCDMGRLGYKHVHEPGRLTRVERRTESGTGTGTALEPTSFHGAVAAVADAIEKAGEGGAWALASAWMTNEELYLLRGIFPRSRIALLARPPWPERRFKGYFAEGDRNPSLPGQTGRATLYPDGSTFASESDRNPNRRGAEAILGADTCSAARLAELVRACDAGEAKVLVAFAGMPDFEPPAEVVAAAAKVGTLALCDLRRGSLAEKAHVLFAGAAFAEKEGTYTNGRGQVQRLLPARPAPGMARSELELLHALHTLLERRMAAPAPGGDGRKAAAGGCSAAATFEELSREIAAFGGLAWKDLDGAGRQLWSGRPAPAAAEATS